MCQEDCPPCVTGRATGRFTPAALRGKRLGDLPESGLSGLGEVHSQMSCLFVCHPHLTRIIVLTACLGTGMRVGT